MICGCSLQGLRAAFEGKSRACQKNCIDIRTLIEVLHALRQPHMLFESTNNYVHTIHLAPRCPAGSMEHPSVPASSRSLVSLSYTRFADLARAIIIPQTRFLANFQHAL